MGAPDPPSPASTDTEALRLRIAELERENRALAERATHTAVAERAHRLSESRFRALFEQFPLSVQIFAPDGTTLAVNRAWHELFGLTFEDVVAFNPLHDPQLAPVREYLQRGFAGEVVTIPPHPFDAAPLNGDPSHEREMWLEVTVWPVRDDDGAICEVIVVHRDVTERIETEEALRASEESYRTIFDLSSDAVFVHDFETGTILDANQKACDLHGCTLDELKDLGIGGISDGSLPSDAEHAQAYVQRAAAGEPQRFEWLVQRRNGERIWVEVALHRVRLRGEDRVLANVRDIDDRKKAEAALQRTHGELERRVEERTAELAQAERRFRAIVEASPAPLLLSRLDTGAILYANTQLDALIGVEPGSLVGRTTPDFYYDPTDRPLVLDAVRTEGHVRDFELRIRRADGTPRWVSLTVERLVFDGALALATSLIDITERKEVEEALRERTQELEAIFRALPDLYFRMEADGTILAYRAGRAFGLYTPPEAFLGRRVQDVLPGPVGLQIRDALTEVARTDDLVCFEYMLPLSEERRDFEARLLPLDGNQVIAVVRDITAQKLAEDAIRASEESYRGLFDSLTELVYLQDLEGRFLAVNEAVVRAYGYTRDEVVGQTPEALGVPGLVDPAVFADTFARAVSGEPQRFEWWGRRKDGSTFPKDVVIKRSTYFGQDVVIAVARDITERKEAEQALRESEALKRGIVAAALDSIITVDGDGRIVEFNPAAERTFGYRTDEVLGQPMADFIVPHRLREAHATGMDRYQRTGEAHVLGQRIEVPALRADGSEFPAELAIDSVRLEDGREVFTAYLRDITERKEAEQALRRSEEHFRRLIENGMDLIQLIDAEGTTRYVSPSVERLVGYTPEEMVGQPAQSGLHPDDVDDAMAALAEAVANPGTTKTAEYRVRHRDGSWRVFEGYGRTFDPASAAEGIVINARDITERKRFDEALRKREEHFRSLIENAHDVTCIIAPDGVMTYLSPSVQRNLGWEPEELVGQSAFAFIHPDDVALVIETLGQVAAVPGTTGVSEYRFRHQDGRWRRLEAIGRTLSPSSTDEGIVANIRDVTERKEAEAEIIRQRAYFEEILNSIDAGIAVFDAAGHYEYVSPKAMPDPELRRWVIGKSIAEYAQERGLPPEVSEPRQRSLDEAISTRAPNEFEQANRVRDGATRYLLRRLLPVLDKTGDVARLIGYSVDITERKEAEETLRLQKTLLEAQGEASIDGILVVSPTGKMVSFNRRFVEMWEIPPEVVASHSDEAALQAVVDQLDDPDEFLARVTHLYEHPDEESRDEIRLRDGRVFDRYSAPVRSQQGDYYGRIWFFRDITERKRAEEALRVSHEREREHAQRLEQELEVGRQIQLSFLPAELLRPAGWEVDTRFQPASQVAGDFYDTFGLPIGRVGLIVADVCGKGVGAALFMALFRSLLRAHAERASASRMGTPHAAEAVLKEAVNSTNQYIARVHKPSHLRKLGHTFASVFFGMLDPKTGTFHYVNAGHEPPVVIGPTGPRLRLRPTGPALGLTTEAQLEVETISIMPGETLLAYTDGVTEARSEDGGFFDEERLLALLDEPAPSAAALLDRIEQAVHEYAAGADPSDDVTLMAIRRGKH